MTSRDFALALELQRQFDLENGINTIPYTPPKVAVSDKLNLGCADLELADPTPNIHALFMQFDKQFFWSSLSSVVVRWSKRMYSCAGICRYQGRDGFCDIALSEPLLKLRSRKNLIETLLHEMIHAYLFVAQKDRDRDGHGPNFQMHMHRINKLANVNITIYHSFIEEVRLYQTHWWRCDGICQNQKPFFGMVRRSSNRAPGPSDLWWKRHSEICGGKFIKIKEPEKVKKKREITNKTATETNASKKSATDLRKYLIPKGKKSIANHTNTSSEIYKTPPNKKIKIDNESTNIFSTPLNSKTKSVNTTPSNNIAETVRNHWNKKYLPDATSSPISKETINKTNLNDIIDMTIDQDFIKKTSPENSSTINSPKSYNEIFQDIYGKDVCLTLENFKKSKNFSPDSPSMFSECPLCNKNVANIQRHITHCLGETDFNEGDFAEQPTELIDLTDIKYDPDFKHENIKDCPICNKQISSTELEEHLEICLNKSFLDEDEHFVPKSESVNGSIVYLSDSDNENEESSQKNESCVPCPCCLVMIDENLMNSHLDLCLSN